MRRRFLEASRYRGHMRWKVSLEGNGPCSEAFVCGIASLVPHMLGDFDSLRHSSFGNRSPPLQDSPRHLFRLRAMDLENGTAYLPSNLHTDMYLYTYIRIYDARRSSSERCFRRLSHDKGAFVNSAPETYVRVYIYIYIYTYTSRYTYVYVYV